jgi:hypothetical protein
LAGAFSANTDVFALASPLQIVGAVLLADTAWGVLWRLTTSHLEAAAGEPISSAVAPYFSTQSPAGRFLHTLKQVAAGASWHELVAALALVVALSLLLGPTSVVLSAFAGAVILWAWVLVQAGKQPAACDALLNVGLPWLLGVMLVHGPSALAHPTAGLAPLLMGLAFTALQWGARRAYLSGGLRIWGAWLGQAVVLLALIALQQSWTLMTIAVIMLPPAWWLWHAGNAVEDIDGALTHSGPWWLAAMMLSAMALR